MAFDTRQLTPDILMQHALSLARAQLGHMNAVFWAEDGAILILTFRSMAQTAWDECAHALTALAARVSLGA